jgi:hypothetical protein
MTSFAAFARLEITRLMVNPHGRKDNCINLTIDSKYPNSREDY